MFADIQRSFACPSQLFVGLHRAMLTFKNFVLWILLKTDLKMPSQSSFTMPFFGMRQTVKKYLNTEQDTFSEKIFLLERRNLVQKSIFSLIICINRNADTSNNLLGFLYITLRCQPFAQCPEKYFKDFKAAALETSPQDCRDEAVPGTWHSTTELHLLLLHPFLSTTHSKKAESSCNPLLQKGRGEKRTFMTFA